jgi:hypothetical protein
LPRSGFHVLLRRQVSLELRGRQIAERRVQAFLVVDLLEECADRSAGLCQIPVFVAVNLLIFKVFMNDSHAALSHGLAFRLMLILISFAFSRSV